MAVSHPHSMDGAGGQGSTLEMRAEGSPRFISVYFLVLTHLQGLFLFWGEDLAHYPRPSWLPNQISVQLVSMLDLVPEAPDASEASPWSSWAALQRTVVGVHGSLQGSWQDSTANTENVLVSVCGAHSTTCQDGETLPKLDLFTWPSLESNVTVFPTRSHVLNILVLSLWLG